MPVHEGAVTAVVAHCKAHLQWDSLKAVVSKYDAYQSVPVIAMDAVFSIQTRYEATVVPMITRYSRQTLNCAPEEATQTVDEFLSMADPLGPEGLAATLNNRQRTSSRGGILKAEALIEFCRVLQEFGVNTLDDCVKIADSDKFCRWIRAIPGQTVSLDYFLMMVRRRDLIKPDTHVLRFVGEALGEASVLPSKALILLTKATERLKQEYPLLEPCFLDHLIWQHMSNRPRTG